MTSKMMDALKAAGIAKEWHKGDMHRLYIDLAVACEMYYDNNEHFQHGRISVNRYERDNGKGWVDMQTCEINTKGISDSDEVISQIMELAAYLMPADEEAEEDAEESAEGSTEEAVAYSVTLANSQCVFDARDVDTVKEAVDFAMGRGYKYKVNVSKGNSFVNATYDDGDEMFTIDVDGWGEVQHLNREQFEEYLKASL